MKLLFITDEFPYPPSKNGNTENIFNIIKQINSNNKNVKIDILYLHILNHNREKIELGALSKYINETHKVFFKSKVKYRLNCIAGIDMFNKVINYDSVIYATLLSGYARLTRIHKLSKNHIYYVGDSRSLLYSKKVGFKNKLRAFRFKIEQRFLFKKFSKVIFVSNVDKSEVERYYSKNNLLSIPVGVNINKRKSHIIKEYDFIFTGNFHFKPNSEAALIIVKEILPEMIEWKNDIKIALVGRNPQKEVIQASKKYPINLIVTGEVKDIDEHILKAKVFISPLISGSGMKNKIVQAMNNKLTVIGYKESFAGFDFSEGLIKVENKNDMIEKMKYFYKNQDSLLTLGELNYKLINEKYSFKSLYFNYWGKLIK